MVMTCWVGVGLAQAAQPEALHVNKLRVYVYLCLCVFVCVSMCARA